MDTSQSGQDFVPSIHCPFWPDAALEWRSRRRRFGWPCPSDIMSIVDFGFPLVPVGHPNSDTNMMEWRLSFSIAERTLVWSFSHIQMQCYAVMKIILKEFIHPHCNPDNRILCSYFIKTFLFWKYENTNPSFWCQESFRNCIMYLLSGFRECVSCGILKHYFVKRFNLLSVKLTETARTELLQAFDIILQSDIRILKECDTFRTVWAQIVSHNDDVISCFRQQRRQNRLRDDGCLMDFTVDFHNHVFRIHHSNLLHVIDPLLPRCKSVVGTSSLIVIVVRVILLRVTIPVVANGVLGNKGNKILYRPCRYMQSNVGGIDISTSRLWYAMILTTRGDYRLSLHILNTVLSSISPCTLYYGYKSGVGLRYIKDETKRRYVDKFHSDGNPITERARKAWMFDLVIMPADSIAVPPAIQIELSFCHQAGGVRLSPYILAYFLMFLNYNGLRMFNNRNFALHQLVDAANSPEKWGNNQYHSYNIAGLCLFCLGKHDQAHDLFLKSLQCTSGFPHHRHNSANYYLRSERFPWNEQSRQ